MTSSEKRELCFLIFQTIYKMIWDITQNMKNKIVTLKTFAHKIYIYKQCMRVSEVGLATLCLPAFVSVLAPSPGPGVVSAQLRTGLPGHIHSQFLFWNPSPRHLTFVQPAETCHHLSDASDVIQTCKQVLASSKCIDTPVSMGEVTYAHWVGRSLNLQ